MDQICKSEGQFQGHKSYSSKTLKMVIYCILHNKLMAKHLFFSKVEKNMFCSSYEVSIAKEFDDWKKVLWL